MFAKLKKKVEDLEGTDLHKLANSISFGSGVTEKASSHNNGRSPDNLSASGSTTSLSSMQGTSKSDESDALQAAEKKWRQKLADVENECRQKVLEVENEWRVKVMVHEHEKEQLAKDRDSLMNQKKKLEEELKEMKGYKDKFQIAEENLEKLRQAKESEAATLNLLLSNATVEVEDFKAKDDLMLEKLDKKEEEIKMLRLLINQSAEAEGSEGSQQSLQDALKNSSELENQLKCLQEALAVKDAEMVRCQKQYEQTKSALDAMTQNWQDAKTLNMNLQDKLAQLAEEKDASLVRNAELSQQLSLCQQQLQRCEKSLDEMSARVSDVEQENRRIQHLLTDAEARDENSERVSQLRSQLAELEAAAAEKNKTIKLQQQRLADMKKTLQKELKNQNNGEVVAADGGLLAVSPAAARKNTASSPAKASNETDEVNFKYLKHVIFKFLTSREYEAQHLTRAVSTLLKLTAEEEKLLKETLEWKMSWFRTKPDLGSGQSALYIPPTH